MELEFGEDLNLAVAYGCVVCLENPGDLIERLKREALVNEFGIIGGVEPYVVNDFGQKHDVIIDFYSVPAGKANGLKKSKSVDFENEKRHVFLGESKRDEVLAEKFGWTYHDFDEIARQEGWNVEHES